MTFEKTDKKGNKIIYNVGKYYFSNDEVIINQNNQNYQNYHFKVKNNKTR